MPRTKSATSTAKPKTKKTVKKSGSGSGSNAAAASRKKAKPVIVDVIEDELTDFSSSSAFSQEPFLPLPSSRQPAEKKTRKSRNFIEEEYIEDEEDDSADDLDQQKKFFSELVSEIKTKTELKAGLGDFGKDGPESGQERGKSGNNKSLDSDRRSRPSVGLYRRFVIKFLILLGILAVAIFYFFFSKLTIFVTPSGETINDSLLLKVEAAAGGSLGQAADESAAGDDQTVSADDISQVSLTDPRTEIAGEIKKITTSVEQAFPASGEEFTGEDIVGQVRLINNYNKDQALVATTRLLSPDNKLFRLKKAVNIPAGGEVTAEIYVEKPNADLAIGPTTFTIPGLWLGLQDKIYARSDTAFVFEKKIKKYVKSSDIERAVKEINEILLKKAKEEISASLNQNQAWLYNTSNPATVTVEANAGEEKDEFLVKATGQIAAVSFDKEEAARLASAKLNILVPDNKELIDFQPEDIIYNLEDYNSSAESATIKASFSGTMVLKSDAEVVNREQLVNLTADQIGTYLKSQPEIKEYRLKFSPSFIKKAPRLVDRIKVVVSE